MASNAAASGSDANLDEPRNRRPRLQSRESSEDSQTSNSKEKSGKTIGKTPSGQRSYIQLFADLSSTKAKIRCTDFVVPVTDDMVSQFSPSQRKNITDLFILLILALQILGVWFLPAAVRNPICVMVFFTWRLTYNVGIGYLLHLQSLDRRLVSWASQSGIFRNPQDGTNPYPALYAFLKREMETKIVEDYEFENAPIEYNTWLVFRRLVDLVLMSDFVSYCLFAILCGGMPADEKVFMTCMRWLTGLTLFFFNLWVKLDAHRVVKDYAWYWGDFFYLIDQKLTFDGVFEMAPHPMYSIGYAGYYGISLMSASYRVLIVSVLAHALQFAFLHWVENPHIEKTYNTPSSHKRLRDESKGNGNVLRGISNELTSNATGSPGNANGSPSNGELRERVAYDASQVNTAPPLDTKYPVHNIIGLKNIDLHRVTDSSVVLLLLYLSILIGVTPCTPVYQTIFIVNAMLWRLWYSVGVGYLLNRQSVKKRWTRHFLKYGESSEEAWRQWKGLYHTAMTMCYASFFVACWKMYTFPQDWNHGSVLLKHVFGVGLIGLHIWTASSILSSLGEFGWFYGDFFYDRQSQLTYSGIYRFLNNPERLLGVAGFWGGAFITGSAAIFCLALLSHILALAFIQFVERPHMQKLYGQSLRRESGFVKSLKRSLPPHILQLHGSVDKMMEGTLDSIEEFLDAARPKLTAGVSHIVKDTSTFFKQPSRIMIKSLSPDVVGYNPKDYSLTISGTPTDSGTTSDGFRPQQLTRVNALAFEYGTPIKVRWTAPVNHSKKDWIGLYMVTGNASREVTQVSSQGRWIATTKDQYGSSVADAGVLVSDVHMSGIDRKDGESDDYMSGEVSFSGDKLWWRTGTYEFRYHHNGNHSVMAISLPFGINIGRFDEDTVELGSDGSLRVAVENILLQLVSNCVDGDAEVAPSEVDEAFGGPVEEDRKYAQRIVYAIQKL